MQLNQVKQRGSGGYGFVDLGDMPSGSYTSDIINQLELLLLPT